MKLLMTAWSVATVTTVAANLLWTRRAPVALEPARSGRPDDAEQLSLALTLR